MSEPITPALSPEEWAQEPDAHGNTLRSWDSSDTMVNVGDDGSIEVNWDGAVYDSRMVRLSPKARHAVAALCLHGQPFGFTQEDVNICLGAAASIKEQQPTGRFKELGERFVLLASRIAALLPPP